MARMFEQIEWDRAVEDDCRQVIRLAAREDLDRQFDWTTLLLVPDTAVGQADVVSRQAGVLAGMPACLIAIDEYDRRLRWVPHAADGEVIQAGQRIAALGGPVRGMLAVERPLLNLLGHLTGIAGLTRRFVEAVAGTRARVFDTRKTTPAYRRLEKYAVRQGGGWNHRRGLDAAVLIKDNHLAWGAAAGNISKFTPAQAVCRIKEWRRQLATDDPRRDLIVEVEVDSLAQLRDVLDAEPEIILLDNMSPELMRQAVRVRDATDPQIELEASGGVRLETVQEIARTGVDRVSVGALTHAAQWHDFGLDWGTQVAERH